MMLNSINRTFQGVFLLLTIPMVSALCQIVTDYDGQFFSGARSSSMADATIADAGDVFAMFRNPASLATLLNSSIFLDQRGELDHRAMGQTIGTVARIGDESRLGVAFTAEHRGRLYPPGEEIKGSRYRLRLVNSLLLAQSLSGGISAAFSYARSGQWKVWGFSASVGLHYSPSPNIGYALTLTGLGANGLLDPPKSAAALSTPLPKVLAAGITMRFPSTYNRPIFTLAIANEKQFNVRGLTYRIGTEYYVLSFLGLRIGYVAGPRESGTRFGLGVRTGFLLIDIASANMASDRRYQISTLINL